MARRGSETHDLKLVLSLQDKASKGLSSFAKQLRSLQKDARSTFRTLDALNRRTSARPNTSGIDAQIKSLRAYRTELRGVARDSEKARNAMRTPSGRDPVTDERRSRRARKPEEMGLLDRAERLDNYYQTGRQIAGVWRDRVESFEQYTDAALRLSQAQSKFEAINLSPEENAKAFAAVQETVKSIRGLKQTDVTESLTDLHTALGQLDEAIEALPMASKFRFGFETVFGDKFSPEEIESQIQQGFKFLEMIGAMKATGAINPSTGKRQFVPEDRARMEQYFSRAVQMETATGGRVTPSEMLQMAKTGGTAVQGLTLEGLTSLSSPLQELGGARTGTALQSMFQSFIAARLQQRSLLEFQRLGLLDKSKVEFNKSGLVKRALPGAIPIGDLLQQNPLEFTDALTKAMQTHGIDTKNVNAVTKEIALLTGNRNAGELTSLLINQRDRVVKEMDLAKHSKDVPGIYNQGLVSAQGQIKEFEANWENLRAEIGKPILFQGAQFLHSLEPFIQFAGQHPYYSLAFITVAKSAGGLLETLSLIQQLRTARTLSSIASAASEIAKPAKEAAAGVDAANSSFRNANSGGVTFVNTLGRMSIALLALYTAKKIWDVKEAYDNLQEQRGNEKKGAAEGYQSFQEQVDNLRKQGIGVPPELIQKQAKDAFEGLNMRQDLEVAFASPDKWAQRFTPGIGTSMENSVKNALWPFRLFESESAWNMPRGVMTYDKPYGSRWNPISRMDASTAVPEFQQRAPMLRDPDVMSAFLKQVRTLDIGAEGQANLNKILSQAFPDSFARATQQASEALSQNADAATKLAPALRDDVTAAQNFAGKVNSLELKPPTLSFTIGSDGKITTGGDNSQTQTGSGKARGGRVFRGISYPVGERGIELFTPFADGFITPNDELSKFTQMTRALQADRKRYGADMPTLSARDTDARIDRSMVYARAGLGREAISIARPSSSRGVSIGSISVTVQANGSAGRIDERKLAALVGAEVASQVKRIVDSGVIHDSVEARINYRAERDDERS